MCESDTEDRLVIPPAIAREIVSQAAKVYVRDCPCRVEMQRCPQDTGEVCLLFENASSDERRETRPISAAEAASILAATAERKVIYNLFYRHTSRQVTELCSCCTCCCEPLRQLKEEGNYGEQLRTDYVAVTDPARCVACGLCEESCFFGARRAENGTLHLDDERCFGCGKCIDSCPEKAIGLERQEARGIPIPAVV